MFSIRLIFPLFFTIFVLPEQILKQMVELLLLPSLHPLDAFSAADLIDNFVLFVDLSEKKQKWIWEIETGLFRNHKEKFRHLQCLPEAAAGEWSAGESRPAGADPASCCTR